MRMSIITLDTSSVWGISDNDSVGDISTQLYFDGDFHSCLVTGIDFLLFGFEIVGIVADEECGDMGIVFREGKVCIECIEILLNQYTIDALAHELFYTLLSIILE